MSGHLSSTESAGRVYDSVTPEIVERLEKIVGPQHVIYRDPERMVDYSHDEVPGEDHTHMPDVVVKPNSAAEISEIMRLASESRIPVTPRGGGSGLSGGAVPVLGGILVSLERMNRILELDTENMVVVAEPGVVTNEIAEAAKAHNMFYAGYPMSLESCFIGGNVAENAGGGRAIKYGVTGRYVLGLEVVLPSGQIIHLGGKRVKDVTGYDLIHLIVGSEGTLGIVTQVTLRLLPAPAERMVLLVPFRDVPAAVSAVPRLMTRSGIVPCSIELMDKLSCEIAYAHVGEKLPHRQMSALLLIEVDGSDANQVEADLNKLADLCLETGALDVLVANTPAQIKKMWRPRQMVAEAFKVIAPEVSGEDIVLPLSEIPKLDTILQRLSAKHGVRMSGFGHVGDGNIHVHTLVGDGMTSDQLRAIMPALLRELYEQVAAIGGTLSGEHGIGSKRKAYLGMVLEPESIALMRGIKAVFDPLHILNPGKIFPDD